MRLLLPLLLLALSLPATAAEPFALRSGDTVLFLGDSNTFAGGFITQIDAVLRTRRPDDKFTLVNLGLPSETCCGLTEKDHPFPRPDIHERLDRALAEIKPTVVFISYGMNDGIYAPFAEERFQAYQAGIRKLLEKVRAAKARPILLTPPPFDPVPLKEKVRPASADDFSYRFPFAGYDGVLRRYADWLVTLRDKDLPVVDVHAALTRYVAERRKTEPGFTLSGDGIHPSTVGHTLIAQAILDGLHFPPAEVLTVDPGKGKREVKASPVVPPAPFGSLFIKAQVPAGARYEVVVDGQVVATASGAELAAGFDLGAAPKFPLAERGKQLLAAVQKQHGTLDLALLTAIGHKRPQTPTGIPLGEARKQAAALEKTLPELTAPATFSLELRKVEP
jgi:lysophospholipase L1-like esterase